MFACLSEFVWMRVCVCEACVSALLICWFVSVLISLGAWLCGCVCACCIVVFVCLRIVRWWS